MGGALSKKSEKKEPAAPDTKLQLANKSLCELSADFLENPLVEEVWVQGNNFTELPEAIGNWKNLVLFYITDNQLHCIPKAVENWSNLEEVNFRYLFELPTNWNLN